MNADQFNAENPIGTPVRYFPIEGVGESIATKTRSEAWALGHGAVVVKIEGRAGCVCISHLEILDRPAPVSKTETKPTGR